MRGTQHAVTRSPADVRFSRPLSRLRITRLLLPRLVVLGSLLLLLSPALVIAVAAPLPLLLLMLLLLFFSLLLLLLFFTLVFFLTLPLLVLPLRLLLAAVLPANAKRDPTASGLALSSHGPRLSLS